MSSRVQHWRNVRRLAIIGVALISLLACAKPVRAEALKVLPAELNGVRSSEMLHAYLMGKAQKAIDKKLADYENLKTRDEIVAYQQRLREFFVAEIGGFPERTPLNAKTVAQEQRDGYRVEKVIFESQPGLYVTALVYLPDCAPPYPAVLVPCGHSVAGKARDLYQRAPILMAKNGMAAMCYDPIEQGERVQLSDAAGQAYAPSVSGHQLMNVGCILLGRSVATFRIWDGMRCVDYLQTRNDIDPARIGCTGISGGGTLTSYLMALDDRILTAAPGCYITSLRRHVETTGPQDAEQNIHGQIAFGMGHEDYVMMRAPKPTLILTATDDYFDIRGAWDSFRMAKRLYGRLGYAERVDLFETPGEHDFPQPMREAACRWMRRWLLNIDDAVTEQESPIAQEEQTWCTPGGRAILLPGARSTYAINSEYEHELAQARKARWQQSDIAGLLREVRTITGIRSLDSLSAVQCEKIASVEREGYRIDKLILKPEETIWLPALAFVPPTADSNAYLYVHGEGKEADAAVGGPIEALARQGHVVLAVDLRGLGETQSSAKPACDGLLGGDWPDMYLAYVLNTSYLAMRAEDILACARFLQAYSEAGSANQVHLISVGRTGPPALHAAALTPELFATVTLRNSLTSWADVVGTPKAKRQLENVVHGALRTYDLPDLLATFPPAKITVIEPVDATESPLSSGQS